ncbi:unnamed protein product [Paramecium octaurelia]|uniref:Protein kinase domain containing protein n=1 Tax=Paramecium octaurelia TaxID=43137 RepID=A0A8S1SAR2_PAROT|nr:unnamed protein product [Paramecium octaurelia]
MGCAANKQDKDMADNPFFVGPSLFINLKGGDLLKHYRIEKHLGKGAQGEVNLVVHLMSEQKRAMKKIIKSQKINEKLIANECQIMMYFDHPNIVKIYELFQDSSHFYIVYEYLSGGELLELLNKKKELKEQQIANYIKQVLEALNHCHTCGIVHKDVKPQNILLESDEQEAQIKLIDFGAAKPVDQNDVDVAGTPLYIAPEAITDNSNEKSDVWSCGIMTLQLLTGSFPYRNETDPQRICEMITRNEIDYTLIDKIKTNKAKAFLKKMLCFDPKNRYTVEQALLDPWIQDNKNNASIDKQVLENLKQFHSCSKLQQAILQLIASTMMNNKDKQKLIQQFKSMDRNGDGKLSHQELKQGYMKIYNDELKAEHVVQEILKKGDFNHSDTLEYSEFLVAASQYNQLVEKDKIEKVFKLFDQDGNGQITIAELKKVMAGAAEKSTVWKDLIKDFDQNGDGQISHQEFFDTLMKKIQENQ